MSKRNIQSLIFLILLLGISLFGAQKITIPKADDAEGKLKLAFLDIGQGDSILITTPHKRRILIDGGPDNTVLTRLGEELPFNERTIDLAIASHNHSDHITGLNSVLERYNVKQMWISGAIHTTNEYLRMLEAIRYNHIPTEVVWKGKTAEIDGVTVEVLHPIEKSDGIRPEDQHDATVVVRLCYIEECFLLTGDINETHEQNIIRSFSSEDEARTHLQSQVLKEPHHGSASGLALNFLNLVNPQYAVIQVGKENKFGHPAPSILTKLQDKGVKVYRNDIHGTVYAITDGHSLSVTSKK